jgi:hypothetical protein
MARKSAAALSVVRALPQERRPEPPEELTAEQAEEWRAIVSRLPVEWFQREGHALLAQYCRHVVRARQVAATLDGLTELDLRLPENLAVFDKLSQIADREGRAMTSLATKMRLTQQSRYQAQKAERRANSPTATSKPWQHIA